MSSVAHLSSLLTGADHTERVVGTVLVDVERRLSAVVPPSAGVLVQHQIRNARRQRLLATTTTQP